MAARFYVHEHGEEGMVCFVEAGVEWVSKRTGKRMAKKGGKREAVVIDLTE